MASRKLIGRVVELDVATDAMTEVIAGRGRVLILAGEPGIGKTRLADEMAALARASGLLTCFGRCWEAGGAPVYWPWIEVVRALLRALPGLNASSLGELVGEVSPRTLGPGESAAEARFRMFDAVVSCLRDAGTQQPMMLVIDDVHMADEASVHLLHFVARALRDLRVLLVLTTRESELRSRPEIATLVDAIARDGERLTLARFDRGQIGEFARARGIINPPLDALADATEGNPLCLGEAVRFLTAHSRSNVTIPEGVRQAIAGNLERLDDSTRDVLAVAAVIGRRVRRDDLEAVLARRGSNTALDAVLRAAATVGAITCDDSTFEFTHILVRESLYDRLSPARRAQLHEDSAKVLEDRSVGDESVAAIAHHYARSGAGGANASIAYSLRAGRRALELLAAEEAHAHYNRALASPSNPTSRAEALLGLAEAHVLSGQLPEARSVVNDIAEQARAVGDPTLLARAALVLGGEIRAGAIDGTLVLLLEEALAKLPTRDSALRARVLARLAAAKQPHPDSELPVRMARDAVAVARRIGDRATLAYTLHNARAAFMPRGHLRERIAITEESLSLAEEVSDRAMARFSHLRLACDRLEDRDVEGCLQHIDQLEALDPSAPPRQRWRAPLLRAMLAVMQGDFPRADAFVARAKSFIDDRDDNAATALVFHGLGRLRTEHRHTEFLAAAARADGGGGGQSYRSQQQVLINMYAATYARERDATLASYAVLRAGPVPAGVAGLTSIAESAAFVGTDDEVARYYNILLEQADTIDVWGTFAFHATGSTQRTLGLLAARLGRHSDAIAHFARAIEDNGRIGATPFVCESELAWAETLVARDGALGDEARGRLQHARTLALGIALTGILPRIDALLGVPGSVSSPDDVRSAFVAEGDVWAVTWEQRTFRLKNARGLQLLVHLLERPNEEVHVLELAALVDGAAEVAPQGSAGPTLDARAKSAFRARLQDLSTELAEAEANADRGRIERTRGEIEALTDELASAVGLGGRDRASGSAAERARVRVQKRLADACKRIEEHTPTLARLLVRRLRTGTFCSYRPSE